MKKRAAIRKSIERRWYTQREWDRTVGWGKVPDEYAKPKKDLTDEEKSDTFVE